MKQETKDEQSALPGILAHVNAWGIDYTIDLKLREFRVTVSPWESIRFDSEKGEQLCRMLNLVTCTRCGICGILPRWNETTFSTCGVCLSAHVTKPA